MVRTELLRGPEETYGFIIRILKPLFRTFGQITVEKGALTQLYLATSPDVENKPIRGQFYDPLASPSKPYTKWGTDTE